MKKLNITAVVSIVVSLLQALAYCANVFYTSTEITDPYGGLENLLLVPMYALLQIINTVLAVFVHKTSKNKHKYNEASVALWLYGLTVVGFFSFFIAW